MKILVLLVFVFNLFLLGLPNDVLADKYLIAAKKYVKAKEYQKAVDNFEKIFDLGIVVPDDLYYFYAKSLKNSGNIIKAYNNFNLYIEKTSKGGKHYQEALGFIIDLEDDVNAKKEKERLEKINREIQQKKEEKESLFKKRIKKSHNKWIFIEENETTYYGMISLSKKDNYIAWLKIGVFNDVLKYIFVLQFNPKEYDMWESVKIDKFNFTNTEDSFGKKHILHSGDIQCKNNSCVKSTGNLYTSRIEVNIDKLEDLLLLQKSSVIYLDYHKLYMYDSEPDLESSRYSGFTMYGGNKGLKEIIDIIIKRKNLHPDSNMIKNVVVDYKHNLMWEDQKYRKDLQYSWSESKKYCETLSLNNFHNWRLATLDEYKTQGKSGYDGNRELKFKESLCSWTSTKVIKNNEIKYYQIFDNEGIPWDASIDDKYTRTNVRCVRDLE